MKKVFLLAILATILPFLTEAQDDQRNAVSVSGIQGLKAFSTLKKNPIEGSYNGVEVGYLINLENNGADWSQPITYLDLKASYRDLRKLYLEGVDGSRGVFGQSLAFVAALDVPIFRIGNVAVIGSPGIGVMYNDKNFYNTQNKNLVSGTSLNIDAQMSLGIDAPISKILNIKGGLTFSHGSNSATMKPNNGMNELDAVFGVVTRLPWYGPDRNTDPFGLEKWSTVDLEVTYGVASSPKAGLWPNPYTKKNMYPDTVPIQGKTPGIPEWGLTALYNLRLHSLFSVKFGIDAVYTSNSFSWNKPFFSSFVGDYTAYSKWIGGPTIGFDLWLGRLVGSANYGWYAWGKFFDSRTHTFMSFSGKYFLTNTLAVELKSYAGHFGGGGVTLRF